MTEQDDGTAHAQNDLNDSRNRSSHNTASASDAEKHAASVGEKADEPPDGGYGWVCVACCFLINAHTWGINSSYGVFLSYYLANNYYPGATALEFAFVGGLSISQALLVSPVATSTTRLFGTSVTLLIGVGFEALALIGASFTHEIWQLFLSQGVCFGFGMGFLFVGSVGVVPQWFTKKRSLANGIGTAGSGIGGMMYSLATEAMIESLGVQWAFRILGMLAFVVNFICAILMKDRNKAIGASQLAFDYRLFMRKEYLLILGWGFFSMLGYIVLLFSLPNYALTIGLTSAQGSVIGALLNLGQGLGRPLVGIFSDSVGRINIAGFCTLLAGIFCFAIWIPAQTYGVLIFFAIIVGTCAGTFWTTIGPVGGNSPIKNLLQEVMLTLALMVAEVVGLKELPSALSITWLALVFPTTFSEPIALQLRASRGNIYLHAQVFAGFMYMAAALCMWALRAWKIGQIQQLVMEEANAVESVDATSNQSKTGKPSEPAIPAKARSSILKRLIEWKKV